MFANRGFYHTFRSSFILERFAFCHPWSVSPLVILSAAKDLKSYTNMILNFICFVCFIFSPLSNDNFFTENLYIPFNNKSTEENIHFNSRLIAQLSNVHIIVFLVFLQKFALCQYQKSIDLYNQLL